MGGKEGRLGGRKRDVWWKKGLKFHVYWQYTLAKTTAVIGIYHINIIIICKNTNI
jgi:hypothetical protein